MFSEHEHFARIKGQIIIINIYFMNGIETWTRRSNIRLKTFQSSDWKKKSSKEHFLNCKRVLWFIQFLCIKNYELWPIVMTNSYKIQNTREMLIRIKDPISQKMNKKDWKWFLYQHFTANATVKCTLVEFFSSAKQNQPKITSGSHHFLD